LFEKLRIEKIHIEVFYNNLNVIRLHLFYGYKFDPAGDRVIQKNGKDVLLVAMSLEKGNWNTKRYARNKSDFPVCAWQKRPEFLA
jgi:hypothetical protein